MVLAMVLAVGLSCAAAQDTMGQEGQHAMGSDAMAMGQQVSVTITNTTEGQTFSAPVLLAHSGAYLPYDVGREALPELVPLAEDGDPSELLTVASVLPSIYDVTVAPAALAPGESVTLSVHVDAEHPLVSALAMLVSSNDAVFTFGADLSAAVGASGAMAGEDMAGDAMAGEAMAGDSMAGDAMAGDAMAGDAWPAMRMAGEEHGR